MHFLEWKSWHAVSPTLRPGGQKDIRNFCLTSQCKLSWVLHDKLITLGKVFMGTQDSCRYDLISPSWKNYAKTKGPMTTVIVFWLKFHWKVFLRVQVQVMAWQQIGNNPLPEQTRTTRTPAFWGYPPTPHYMITHTIDQFILNPKSILLTSSYQIPSQNKVKA